MVYKIDKGIDYTVYTLYTVYMEEALRQLHRAEPGAPKLKEITYEDGIPLVCILCYKQPDSLKEFKEHLKNHATSHSIRS